MKEVKILKRSFYPCDTKENLESVEQRLNEMINQGWKIKSHNIITISSQVLVTVILEKE